MGKRHQENETLFWVLQSMVFAALASLVSGCVSLHSATSYHQSLDTGAAARPVQVVIHGTFSEGKTKRLPVERRLGDRDVLELHYPTTEVTDEAVDAAVVQHMQTVRQVLATGRDIELSAFSQGSCLGLDLVSRLRPDELAALRHLLLLSPAFSTYLDLGMTERMEAHCRRAQQRILDEIATNPDGELAKLIEQRTAVAEVKGDVVVRYGVHQLPIGHTYTEGRTHLFWIRGDNWTEVVDTFIADLAAQAPGDEG